MERITPDRKITCPKCGTENLGWHSRCEKCGEDLHKQELALPKFESRGAGFWLAFGVGLAGLLLLSFIIFLGASISGDFPTEAIIMLFFPVLGLILCWKWLRISAVLLIIGGILPMVFILMQGGIFNVVGFITLFFLVVLPLVSSGVIFWMVGKV